MNSKRKNYTMVLNTSLLCFALASGQAVFAQNNVNTSQKGAVQAHRTAVIAKGVVTDDSQDPPAWCKCKSERYQIGNRY